MLLLGVVTLPHRVLRRRLMRETTFANASQAVRAVFLLGRNTAAVPYEPAALAAEQRRHGDLLLLPGVEERGRRFKSMDCARKTHLSSAGALRTSRKSPSAPRPRTTHSSICPYFWPGSRNCRRDRCSCGDGSCGGPPVAGAARRLGQSGPTIRHA
mmetsp:Transcript_1565/g.4422  ORF Transcript_1565/g.4422 Transcript_1565/m.4422 type:complete len:156 (+) Transcript_1565:104-571(+)